MTTGMLPQYTQIYFTFVWLSRTTEIGTNGLFHNILNFPSFTCILLFTLKHKGSGDWHVLCKQLRQ